MKINQTYQERGQRVCDLLHPSYAIFLLLFEEIQAFSVYPQAKGYLSGSPDSLLSLIPLEIPSSYLVFSFITKVSFQCEN